MNIYVVRTPVVGFDGDVGAIHFANGVASVPEGAQEITYLRAAGYLFEDPEAAVDEVAAEETVVEDVDGDGKTEELPKKVAPVGDWRAFAVEHGMTQADADAMTKDALIAHYAPKEG
jgi:hypothetical protein